MKLSLILLRHDIREELFKLTANAVKTLNADENILIDNGSSFGQVLNWADVEVRNKTNIGYPAAVNQGFKLATGDFIAVANNDIRVLGNWREAVEDVFNSDKIGKEIGSLHFRMVNYDSPMQAGYNTWETGKERWCSASFYVIRREALQFYDENYKEGGYDDWDFFYRLRKRGFLTAYTTKSCYQHKHSSTYIAMDDGNSRKARDQKNREYFKSKFGGYAEDLFALSYPDQVKEDYYGFFNTL